MSKRNIQRKYSMSETRFEPRTSNLPCVGEGANYCTTGEAEKVNESTQLNKCVSTPEMLAIPVILALKSGIVLFVIPKIPYDNCSLTRDQSAVTAPFVTSAAQTLCSGNSEMSAPVASLTQPRPLSCLENIPATVDCETCYILDIDTR